MPWVKTGELRDNVIVAAEESITSEGIANSAAHVLPAGTLLVAMYGATIGKLGILGIEAATNQACAALLPNGITAEIIPFIFQYLLSQRENLKALGQGGAQPNISQVVLKGISCPLPPLAEQRRIVSKIESLTTRSRRAKGLLDAVPTLLEKFRQSVLAAAFRGDLTAEWRSKNPDVEPAEVLMKRIRLERRKRWEEAELAKMRAKGKVPADDRWKAKYEEPAPVDTSELLELPEGWGWASLDELSLLITKGSSPGWQGFEYVTEGVLFVRSQNVGWGDLELTERVYVPVGFNDHEPRSIVHEGDVLLNIVGASIGRSAVATATLHGANTNQAVAIIRCIAELIPPHLLMYWLLSPVAQRVIHLGKVEVARANFSLNDIRRIAVPVPPANEQVIILSKLQRAFQLSKQVEKETETCRLATDTMNRSILDKAFRGELVPQNPNDEPAAVLLERIRNFHDAMREKAKPIREERHKMKKKEEQQLEEFLPSDKFTFEELHRRVAGDYDKLKEDFMALLDRKDSRIRQVFDKSQKRMSFERVTK